MRFKALKLTTLATGLALLAGMAMAQDQTAPPKGGHPMHGGFMAAPGWGMMYRQLGLTDEQKSEIRQMFQSERAAIQPLRGQQMAAHLAMMQLITSGNFDQSKAAAVAAQASQVDQQLEVEYAKVAAQVYQNVLNADQKAKVSQLMAQHEKQMQQRIQGNQGSAQPNNE